MKIFFPILFSLLLFTGFVFAQETDSLTIMNSKKKQKKVYDSYEELEESIGTDSTKSDYDRNYLVDFLLNYTLFSASYMPDSAPITSGASGLTHIGIGYDLSLRKWLALRFELGFSFLKINFSQTTDKTFPTVGDSLYVYERLKTNYMMIPLAFRFIFHRTSKGKVDFFADAGFNFGVLLGGSYKLRLKDSENGDRAILKLRINSQVNPIRYGAFGRMMYKFIGLYANYRLSTVYKSNLNYPKFSQLEYGVSLILDFE